MTGVALKTLDEVVGDGGGPALTSLNDAEPLTLSHSELQAAIAALKESLTAAGLRKGDVVSIVLSNSIEFVASFLATTAVGAVAAPLNATYTADEFKFYFEDANTKVVIVDRESKPENAAKAAAAIGRPVWQVSLSGKDVKLTAPESLQQDDTESTSAVTCEPDDVALFLHTSGTTSRPKGVPLTHKNLCISIRNISQTYMLSSDDTTMLVMPLFHVHGLMCALLSSLAAQGHVVIPAGGKFSASKFWNDVRRMNVTWYTAVPTIHQILLARSDTDFPSDDTPRPQLRFIRSCSSALAPATLEKLEATFKSKVLEAYAMTEAAHQMCSNPLHGERRPGTVGKGTNVDVATLSSSNEVLPPGTVGEVCIKGENVTKGYLNNPEANEAAFAGGWFHTGDQGLLSEDGYLTLTGRIKELINRGGEKISPLEVDAALLAHPAVAEAVSFGAPDPKYGEEVNAAIVVKTGADAPAENDLQKFCAARIASFKVPKRFFFDESLPRTATGKIQRRIVASHFLKSE
mmetsp:Transcript_7146/g.21793  ORF Transcript_7146/g.21793 Transcript_7146/m.21793 type:complete len:518 (-) Transcript_7146:99-1652(-)|eukprot:CAMPEP_0198728592 /NCGR_PEP_ID=MMETSP1475-20131203/10219_1 /TAXON_ID= ORGANISM="Unidentified sp., Strain CCMP1999" /NCGR_SAMPLE_ID=MMETSP1475 /ASSEMBLY_ACC=CAM_ASM_001111 /LENGTH=517 /DNA_ID=CAMNT_0044491003 /DNA_START=38 /DNA_END=1591 /DNA_ORIENTATION=-